MVLSDAKLAYLKEYRRTHKAEARAYHQQYYKEHRLEQLLYGRKWRRQNMLCVNGKYALVRKRPRPNDICELCDKSNERLHYHHWDDNHPELGLWLCPHCHRFAEAIEQNDVLLTMNKYLEMKQLIEEELTWCCQI